MQRRTFLHSLGLSMAGLAFARRAPFDFGTARHLDRVGLQLYSVRNAMKRDPTGTLAAVRDIGYRDVELLWTFDNFGQTPAQVRSTLDGLGLTAPSAHIAPELLLGDWARALDQAKYLGHQYLIVPSLPDETKTSLDAWRHWADVFNTAGAAARTAGIWLAQHNEPEHVHPIDGQIPYDLFIERTDPKVVRLQLDFGNMVVGSGDPMAYLKRYGDRYWTFHVKNVVADRTHDTELDAGVLDLSALLGAVTDIDAKPCYVEQESPADELASARSNYEYLSKLAF